MVVRLSQNTRLENQAVLLLATARLEEVEETPALRRALEELAAESRVAQLTLRPLSQQETERLVEALAQRGPQPAEIANVAQRAWALSEGNPFMIVETTRAIREGRRLGTAAALGLPERIREVIAGQLARLSELSQALVGVAALIGREFDFPVLQMAADISAREAARGIEELVRRRVLQGVGERLDFAHDRIREVASEGLLAPQRKLLHARIARALEKVYAQNLEPHLAALGMHYREGGVWERAVHYLRQAGLKAAARSALRDALSSFELALVVLEALPESPARLEQAFDIRLELRPGFAAHALHLLGDIATHPDRFDAENGEAHYRHALALAEPHGMRPLIAHCHLGLGKLYQTMGKREEAQGNLRSATTMYREMGMLHWLEQVERGVSRAK